MLTCEVESKSEYSQLSLSLVKEMSISASQRPAPSPVEEKSILTSQQLAVITTAATKAEREVKTRPNVTVEVEARFRDITVGTFGRVRTELLKLTRGVVQEIHSTDYIINGQRRTVLTLPTGNEIFTVVKRAVVPPLDLPEYPIRISISTEEQILETKATLRNSQALPIPGIESEPTALSASADLIRDKHRWRFAIAGGIIYVDLTAVSSSTADERRRGIHRDTWEIETEIFGAVTPDKLRTFDLTIQRVLRLVYDTRVLYTISEQTAVISAFNRILKSKMGARGLDYDALVKARNLKRRDCVWGGLLGGNINYAVTPKADGWHKELFLYESGLWLVYPPKELNRLTRGGVSKALQETILDGELIPSEKRTDKGREIKQEYFYLGFDIMADAGLCSVQNDVLWERLHRRDQLAEYFNPKILTTLDPRSEAYQALSEWQRLIYFENKPFYPLGTSVEELEATMARIRALIPTLNYQVDGGTSLMFTPIEAPYNPHSDVFPLRQRVLTAIPDTCKLKPWDELTMDFRLQWVVTDPRKRLEGEAAPGVLIVNRRVFPKGAPPPIPRKGCEFPPEGKGPRPRKESVRWEGDLFYPLDPVQQIDWKHPFFAEVQTNSIVELGPEMKQLPGGESLIVLKPTRLRPDKPEPNDEEIVNDVWDDINRPLTLETLEGETLALAIQYHNHIKRLLFIGKEVKSSPPRGGRGRGRGGLLARGPRVRRVGGIPPGADLVDIGAGAGGDLSRQRHLHRIVAVEPSEQNAAEYRRRASVRFGNDLPMIDRIRLLVTGGENTEAIVRATIEWFDWKLPGTVGWKEPPPLYISMMLSLSFFWRDAELLQGLANTLQSLRANYKAAGGMGDVHFVFFTIDGPAVLAVVEQLGPTFALANSYFQYTPPNSLHVHIEDSIVTDQNEYLVNLPELEQLTSLTNVVTHVADEEKFLSTAAKTYTSMYTYGTAIVAEPTAPSTPKIYLELKSSVTRPVPEAKSRLIPIEESAKPNRKMFTPVPQMSSEVAGIMASLDPLTVDETKVGAGFREELPGLALTSKGDDILQSLGSVIMPDTKSNIILPEQAEYFRVTTLDEGSSFFASLLKMTSPTYNRVGASERIAMAREMRTDLIAMLAKVNKDWPTEELVLDAIYEGKDPRASVPPNSTGAKLPLNSYYYTLDQGAVHRLMARAPTEIKGYDYLAAQLKTMANLPSYMFSFVASILGVNLNVYKVTAVSPSKEPTRKQPALRLTAFHGSAPPRGLLSKDKPLDWKRPTLALLELEGYVYQPIAYRTPGAPIPGAVTFIFDSRSRTYTL